MDEQTYQKIQQYQQALKALQRSVEHSIHNETYEGTGRMAVKSYQGIQRKVAEVLSEDFYVTDTLSLEVEGELKERHMLSQVQLAASQMMIYLDGILRDYRVSSGTAPADWGELKNWGRTFGRDIQEQIINMTRATIERAVRNVDIDVQGPDSMRGADMEGANLEGANFSGRNLRDANMKSADLRNGNFSGANLAGASLEGADTAGANFTGANFKDADLRSASFVSANLTGANFKGANLENADLSGTQIFGANFKDANLKGATMPRGEVYHNEGDLVQYGAGGRASSTGKTHVRIEITDDEDKRKNDEDASADDEDMI